MLKWDKDKNDQLVLGLQILGLVMAIAIFALAAGFVASMASAFWRWTIGLFFAVVTGWVACPLFLGALRGYIRVSKPHVLGRSRNTPTWLVGSFESLVFSVAIGVFLQASPDHLENLGGVLAAMGLWLGAKMLAGWNRDVSVLVKDRPEREREQRLEERARIAFSAILGGALNLAIATVGGNIAGGGAVVSGGACVFKFVHRYL